MNKELLDLRDVVGECFQIVGQRARQAGITLHSEFAPDLQRIAADRRAIKQILLNVLTNAVIYMGRPGEVRVTAGPGVDGCRIHIHDNGVGIPADKLSMLTRPFETAGRDPYVRSGGVGLGLAITEALVKLHGGTLDIDSTLGQGTTVLIELPVG